MYLIAEIMQFVWYLKYNTRRLNLQAKSKKKHFNEYEKRAAEFSGSFQSSKKLNAFDFIAFQASCAHIVVYDFSFLQIRNFLYVCLKCSLCFAVGVAYVVSRHLTFSANTAYSRHIFTSDGYFI